MKSSELVLYYSYSCVRCGEVWNERYHTGRKFTHCPRHRTTRQNQRARKMFYAYVCLGCAKEFYARRIGRRRLRCVPCARLVNRQVVDAAA